MSTADTYVRARIDTRTKERAADALEAMGLSISDAIRLLMLRVADERRLPFEVKVPNATTRKAMAELEAGKGQRFASVDELMADLHADDCRMAETALPSATAELARKAGLPEHAVAALLTVLGEDPRVQGLVLYGSRAMDRYRRGSDIDLCLEAPVMALPDLWQLADRVDDLLLPWKVDLQLRHSIDNPDLLAHIDRVGQAWLRR